MVEQRGLATLPVRENGSGEGERLGARQCRLTRARQWPRRWRWGRGRQGRALGGLAWPEARWNGRSSLRRRWSEMGGVERVEGASEASTRCVATWRRRGSWQAGSSTAYGRHLAGHAAADGDCPTESFFWIGRLQWLKLELCQRFTLSSIGGFGWDLILWVELHEFYNFDYISSV